MVIFLTSKESLIFFKVKKTSNAWGWRAFFGHVTFRRRQLRVGRDGELFDLEGVGVGDLLLEGVS